MLRKSCLNSMMDPLEDTTVEIILHTKSSDLDTIGPPYSNILMCMQGYANNVKS
jgi:hypothetical protein